MKIISQKIVPSRKLYPTKLFSHSAFLILLSLFISCERIPRKTTICDVTSVVRFANDDSSTVKVIFADSTNWGIIEISKLFIDTHFPDSSLFVPAKSIRSDTLQVVWAFEHKDIYSPQSPCSSEVRLDINAIICDSATGIIKSIQPIEALCDQCQKDTTKTDSLGYTLERYWCSQTIFIQSLLCVGN